MGKKNSSKSNYIMQGSILAIASIVSRIIGLLYRLPVTNIITDHGNDYYSGSLVYIEETGEVTMVNLVTGEQKIVNSTDRS